MRQTLYVRLHRDAAVPGERCDWVLRARSGEALRRGSDPLAQIPRAPSVVGILSQEMVLVRSVRLPPGRRARTPVALAAAIEPYLLSDPAANHVIALGDESDGTTVIAAVARAWLDACVAALAASGHAPERLAIESDLVGKAAGTWTAVCHADGGFLCTGRRHVETLDACAPGAVPQALRLLVSAAPPDSRPGTLAVHGHSGLGLDATHWARELGVAVEARGPWDWIEATALERGSPHNAMSDLLRRVASSGDAAPPARRWRLPVALAAAALVLHVGATALWWAQRSAERTALNERIGAAFQRAVGPQVPLVDARIQTERALDRARRAAGEYADADFVPLLARVAALATTAGLPPGALRTLAYSPGSLVLEWENVPPAALERLAAELKAQALRVEVARQGARATLSVRRSP